MNTATRVLSAQTRAVNIYYCGIFLVSFFLFLLFSHHMPITDPVESNYTLTAKEMVQTSDWLSPRIYGQIWYDKPVFFYWLTALAYKMFGFSELASRTIPAFFAAVGLVFLCWFVNKVSSRPNAFLATLLLGTSLEYAVLSKLVITDMVFFVFNSLALIFFYLGYSGANGKKKWYLSMYAMLGLAVLTKGPVGLLLPGLVAVIFIGVKGTWGELREMSAPAGILLFLVITLPWYGAMYAEHGADFINTFFGVHNYLRATVSEHPKDNVIYYYFAVFIISMLPWSALAIKAIIWGYKEKCQNSLLIPFCLIWIAVYFVFYSLMATKYLTYIFPILFPVAILTALYLEHVFVKNDIATVIFWGGLPCILLAISYVVVAWQYLTGTEFIITAASLVAASLMIGWQAKGKDIRRIFGILCFCPVVFWFILSIHVFPHIAESRSGKDIAAMIVETGSSQVGMYKFYSTSAVFYSGKVAVEIEPADAVDAKGNELLGWEKKYTMPVRTLDQFASGHDNMLIIVPAKFSVQFAEEAGYLSPRLVKADEEYLYYKL